MLSPRVCLLLGFLLSQVSLQAGGDEEVDHHHSALMPSSIHPAPGRKYARDRLVDIRHLSLDMTPDFAQRSIHATVALTFAPIGQPLAEWELDAVRLGIEKIEVKGAPLASHEVSDTKLKLYFKEPIPVGAEVVATITYHVQPENGLYFRTPEMGYKPGDTQVWSQGEAEFHRYWFPCYDYPNMRFTSEVTCHVPEGMQVISNGKLISQEKEAGGLFAWHWKQDETMANYLLAVAAGYFHKIEDKLGELPLALYVPPSEKEQAPNAFLDTKAILEFYQQEIGVPFAWDKYSQVYCLDFMAGGMENASCTFQAAGLLYSKESEQLQSLHSLDAHEAAHQWFGDLVTCRDWSHLWLNEGFATYYADLYEGHKLGREAMLFRLWKEAQGVLENQDTKPIVWKDYQDAIEQFDYRAYPKGAWVLHMMRSRLGDDLYRKGIQTYLARHQHGNVTTDDLLETMEQVSGLSFDQFADQWLYHGGTPALSVRYSWNPTTKLAQLTVHQTQKVDEKVLLFRFDLPVRFFIKGQCAPVDFKVTVSKAEEDFHFTLPAAPELVRLDPDYTVLMKVDFSTPPDMVKKQLQSDLLGRLFMVKELGNRKDTESIELLKQTLNNDAFFGVREEAAKSLKKIYTPEARGALIASLSQPDARVRMEVVYALAAFSQAEAQEALWKLSETERNPEILAAIIRTWGTRPGDAKISAALRQHLTDKSYHNVVTVAVIDALRAQDDTSAVGSILKILRDSPLDFPTLSFAKSMDGVAFLARDPKTAGRDDVLAFLSGQLSSPKAGLRSAAAKSLGTLHDPRALALLEPLTKVSKPYNDPVSEAAEGAVQILQTTLEGSKELKNLWDKVQQLEKKSEELEQALEKVKKRAEAIKP